MAISAPEARNVRLPGRSSQRGADPSRGTTTYLYSTVVPDSTATGSGDTQQGKWASQVRRGGASAGSQLPKAATLPTTLTSSPKLTSFRTVWKDTCVCRTLLRAENFFEGLRPKEVP